MNLKDLYRVTTMLATYGSTLHGECCEFYKRTWNPNFAKYATDNIKLASGI